MTTAVDAVELAGTMAAHDMSMLGMFMQADIVVKAVMILLLGLSVWCWATIFQKMSGFKTATQKADAFQEKFWESDDLDECYEVMRKGRGSPLQRVFIAGMQEWYASNIKEIGKLDQSTKDAILARIDRIMAVARNRELDRMERKLGFMATLGATAPFIGLFGTVWGIMNAFQSIAVEKNTSLVVVAPGIAEALFVTAMGLFVAIPAVVAYNRFAAQAQQFGGVMEDFCTEFVALLSRQLHARRRRTSPDLEEAA